MVFLYSIKKWFWPKKKGFHLWCEGTPINWIASPHILLFDILDHKKSYRIYNATNFDWLRKVFRCHINFVTIAKDVVLLSFLSSTAHFCNSMAHIYMGEFKFNWSKTEMMWPTKVLSHQLVLNLILPGRIQLSSSRNLPIQNK
jgi:hypothetical protein